MSENQSELRSRRDELIGIIQSIESQLAQRDKTDLETGERLNDHEYHEWRARALAKRKHLLDELRLVKAELAESAEQEHREMKLAEREQINRIEEKVDRLLLHFRIAPTQTTQAPIPVVGTRYFDSSHPEEPFFTIVEIIDEEEAAELDTGAWYELNGEQGLLAKLATGVVRPLKGES